jgi:hypothetical protein
MPRTLDSTPHPKTLPLTPETLNPNASSAERSSWAGPALGAFVLVAAVHYRSPPHSTMTGVRGQAALVACTCGGAAQRVVRGARLR